MPFIDDDGTPLRVIRITQAPADGRFFQLNRRIGFVEGPGAPTYWAPPHTPSDDPGPDNRTDLASVPWVFWSFIGSYGRQSAPALVHDHQAQVARGLDGKAALAQRFEDDRVFRIGLRQQKVPLLRAWLMWAFVSVERYCRHAPLLAGLLILQTVLGIVAIWLAVLLGATPILGLAWPLWLLLALVPAAAALLWGREARLLCWLSYSGAVLAPIVAAQLAAVGVFRLIELIVRETIDRPFIDRKPGPVITPLRYQR